jgi:cyclopropane-fatty-acyl-phospholipid synthase
MTLAALVEEVLGVDLPVGVRAYDGSSAGPPEPPATLVFRSPDALRRILLSPGELGVGRAYVAGDLDVEGDIFAAIALRERLPNFDLRLSPGVLKTIAQELGGWREALRPIPPPPEEVRLRGRRHSPARDRAAISYHYDVSNRFYELVLGPSMTYSCAVFATPTTSLEDAQAAKHELVCRKLDLRPGDRLLDVGCGWGSLAMHAAEHHGAHVVGVTISQRQYELAKNRVSDAGLSDRVEIRLQDYRDVDDGPYDAVSSIGMFEHVGEALLGKYFGRLLRLVKPGGRLLNHGIAREPGGRARLAPRSFANRYVFPDGELHEVGRVVSRVQEAGFESRHVESLREHYDLTLRHWVANLERNWDEAVAEVGPNRARVWRLYMAVSAVSFGAGRNQIHQVLAARQERDGRSGLALREAYG